MRICIMCIMCIYVIIFIHVGAQHTVGATCADE